MTMRLESFAYGDPVRRWRRSDVESRTRSPPKCMPRRRSTARMRSGVDTAWQVGTLGVVTATAAVGSEPATIQVGSPASASSAVVAACTCSRARNSPPRSSCRSASPSSSRGRSSAALPASASTSSASAPFNSPTDTRASGTRTSVETLGASYSVTLGAYGFVSLFANHTRGRVTTDRCVPGLDDALGQSSQRRVERDLSTRTLPPARASRRRPRCSRTCRPARARATT